MARGDIDLEYELWALSRMAAEERRRVTEGGLPTLSKAHRDILANFKKLNIQEAGEVHKTLPLEVGMYLTLEGLREVAKSPYHFSSLRDWLGLETWQPKDALFLLAGICPDAAIVDWSYKNFMGASVEKVRIRAATCLNAIHDRYDIPERDSWDDQIHDVQEKLRVHAGELDEREKADLLLELSQLRKLRDGETVVGRQAEFDLRSKMLGTLSRHWFSGDHDAERRYSPEHFLGWAAARGFKPEWYEWALAQGLIDSHAEVYREPFFDPDSEDYPALLHIAVNAWQAARKERDGTPKQRIERYLQDRYPNVPPTTRELIAQLVNWRRTGGRPRS